MSKELRHKPALIDTLLILLSGIFFCLAAYLLFDDSILFTATNSQDGLVEVGSIVQAENDVRRKVKENFAWLPVKQQMRVFDGDSIFTGPGSSVNLKLNTGAEMSIDENSLIVLKTETNDLSLNLKYGEVAKIANQQGTIYLDQNGSKAEVKPEDAVIRIKATKGKPVEVKVLSGRVNFKEKQDKPAVRLAKNEAIRISAQGVEQKKTYEVELMAPKQSEEIWTTSKSEVPFTWEASDDIKYYQLEISRTKTFEQPLLKQISQKKHFDLKGFPERGKFYWRVLALERQGTGADPKWKKLAASEPRHFKLSEKKSPLLIFPPSGSTLILSSHQILTPSGEKIKFEEFLVEKDGSQPLKFTWDRRNYQNVVFDLAVDSEFKSEKVESKEVNGNEIVLAKIPQPGRYYWRVKGIDKDSENALSVIAELNIVQSLDIQLEKPANLSEYWFRQGKVDIAFQWAANEAIKIFEIEISTDREFSKSLVKKVTETKVFNLSQFAQKGSFYWRVTGLERQKNPDGLAYRKIVSSEIFSFSVDENKAPLLVSPEKGSTVIWSTRQVFAPDQKLDENATGSLPAKLTWQNNGYKNVTVEISAKNDFSQVKTVYKITDSKEEYNIPDLPDGKYFWRVRGNDQSNRENLISATFDFNLIKVIPKKALPKPEIKDMTKRIELRPDGSGGLKAYDLSGQNKPYLDWQGLNDAENYRVIIAEDKGLSKVITESKTQEPKFDWKTIKPGRFYWNVQAESSRYPASVPSRTGDLVVTVASPKLDIIKSLEEKVVNEEEMKAPIAPVLLKWAKTPLTSQYLVEVSDSQDFAAARKFKSKNDKLNFDIPKPGQYHWRVTALDEKDKEISLPSDVNSFKFNRKYGLRTPATASPAFDSSMVFLSKSASHVVLVWKKVEGAEQYEFELSTDKDFKKPYFANKSKALKEYIPVEIPPGKNYWRIRAVNAKFKSDWSDAIPFVVSYGKNQ